MSKKIQSIGRNSDESSSSSAQLHSDIKILREKITQLVEKKPQKAAIIATDWMRRPPGRATYKKVG